MIQDADERALLSVMAHGMLNSLGVVRGTVSTIRENRGQLDDEVCEQLLARAEDHLQLLTDWLVDLVRGIPFEVRQTLDSMREHQS